LGTDKRRPKRRAHFAIEKQTPADPDIVPNDRIDFNFVDENGERLLEGALQTVALGAGGGARGIPHQIQPVAGVLQAAGDGDSSSSTGSIARAATTRHLEVIKLAQAPENLIPVPDVDVQAGAFFEGLDMQVQRMSLFRGMRMQVMRPWAAESGRSDGGTPGLSTARRRVMAMSEEEGEDAEEEEQEGASGRGRGRGRRAGGHAKSRPRPPARAGRGSASGHARTAPRAMSTGSVLAKDVRDGEGAPERRDARERAESLDGAAAGGPEENPSSAADGGNDADDDASESEDAGAEGDGPKGLFGGLDRLLQTFETPEAPLASKADILRKALTHDQAVVESGETMRPADGTSGGSDAGRDGSRAGSGGPTRARVRGEVEPSSFPWDDAAEDL